MKKLSILFFGGLFLFFSYLTSSCDDGPWKVDFLSARATIVGKEICKTDPSEDYWIIDVLIEGDDPLIGDEVVIEGETYTNTFKTRDLPDGVKNEGIGTQIALEYYPPVGSEKVVSTNCDAPDPRIYLLRELKPTAVRLTYF